jgi:hypothetical protein
MLLQSTQADRRGGAIFRQDGAAEPLGLRWSDPQEAEMPSAPLPPHDDPHQPDRRPETATAMLRHLLATLAYRSQRALASAPDGFGDFDGGYGLRTPLQLLQHMNGLIGRTHARVIGGRYLTDDGDWERAVARWPELLTRLDATLAEGALPPELLEKLQQGPVADAMTHAGQLAMLRRMAGSPIAGENFFEAGIRTGKLDYR